MPRRRSRAALNIGRLNCARIEVPRTCLGCEAGWQARAHSRGRPSRGQRGPSAVARGRGGPPLSRETAGNRGPPQKPPPVRACVRRSALRRVAQRGRWRVAPARAISGECGAGALRDCTVSAPDFFVAPTLSAVSQPWDLATPGALSYGPQCSLSTSARSLAAAGPRSAFLASLGPGGQRAMPGPALTHSLEQSAAACCPPLLYNKRMDSSSVLLVHHDRTGPGGRAPTTCPRTCRSAALAARAPSELSEWFSWARSSQVARRALQARTQHIWR
jgi:hypothetical protein